MANYRISDIIRLTRKTLGMSQEELAYLAGIAPETVSRIESGKHKITQSTYQRIMEVLNYDMERSFAIGTSEEVGILEEKNLLESAEAKYEHEEAGKHIEALRGKMTDTPVNRQYMKRTEVLQAYYEGRTDAKTMLEGLKEALQLTVEHYEQYLDCDYYQDGGYPFLYQELLILMNIASAYEKMENYEQAEKILKMIIDCIDAGYMDGKSVRYLKLAVKRTLSRVLASSQRYEEVLLLLEDTLSESLKAGYGLGISAVLYDISWYKNRVNQISNQQVYGIEEIKRKMRQAYYIATARKDYHVAEVAKKSYEKLFHEECKWLGSSR